MKSIKEIYSILLKKYGYQGWWPVIKENNLFYHPEDYSYPKDKKQRFEIIIGTILTQNTAWKNAAKALLNLNNKKLLDPEEIIKIPKHKLAKTIRSSGYYNQKAARLKAVAKFFLQNNNPSREELLRIKGIGPETADSILLYAYKIPSFVVDTYTKRIFSNLNLIPKKASYEDIKKLVEDNLEGNYKKYQEFHALLVEHAKNYYLRNSKKDFLLEN